MCKLRMGSNGRHKTQLLPQLRQQVLIMKAVLVHRCPNCGGQVSFDITKKRMTCPHCSSDFSVYSFYTDPAEWSTADEQDLGLFVCDSCGGEVTSSKRSTSATCPYCESRLTLAGRLSGKKRPDYIVPFEIGLDKAVSLFKEHLGNKVLLPDAFKQDAHLLKCRRMYLPFFVFNTEATAEYKIMVPSGDSYTLVDSSGQFAFEHLPVDACKSMPNFITEAIEPFDFSRAMPFSPSYLTDCNAEIYDESTDACIKIATKRAIRAITSKLKIEYDGKKTPDVFHKFLSIALKNTNVKYVFFPVWILTTRWRKKDYIFALNGQTGKIVSDLPCDEGKAAKKFWSRFLLVFGIGLALSAIVWLVLL